MRTRILVTLFAGLLAAGVANADVAFKTNPIKGNPAVLNLTDETNVQCPEGTYRAYGVSSDGKKVEGCWVYNTRGTTVTVLMLPTFKRYEIPASIFFRVEKPI